MRSIRDALTLRPATVEVAGCSVQLRRPSAADLVEAIEVSQNMPTKLHAWLAWRHLLENGAPVFASLEQALEADGLTVAAIGKAAEALYSEGRD